MMRSDKTAAQSGAAVSHQAGASAYEPPAVAVLGTLVELTQLGTGPTSELDADGGQASAP